MNERMRRRHERLRIRTDLMGEFQSRITKMPEFRQAAAKKYLADQETVTPEAIDTVIDTFFSKDPQKTISNPKFVPGIDFEKDGSQFNVNFSVNKSDHSKHLTVLKKTGEAFQIMSLVVGKNNQTTVGYTENQNSIILGEKARQKAIALLTTLSQEKQK